MKTALSPGWKSLLPFVAILAAVALAGCASEDRSGTDVSRTRVTFW